MRYPQHCSGVLVVLRGLWRRGSVSRRKGPDKGRSPADACAPLLGSGSEGRWLLQRLRLPLGPRCLTGLVGPASWPRWPYHGCSFVRNAGPAAHVSGCTEVPLRLDPRGHQRACMGKRLVSWGEACSAFKQRRWWGSSRLRCALAVSAPLLSHTPTPIESLVKGGE